MINNIIDIIDIQDNKNKTKQNEIIKIIIYWINDSLWKKDMIFESLKCIILVFMSLYTLIRI